MNTNLLRPLLLAGCGLWIGAVLLSCNSSDGEQENKATAEEIPGTEVVSVQKGKLGAALQLPGELQAFQQVDLYAKVNSFVKKLYVDVGSEVKAGQLLVTLEAPEMNAQLAGAESRLKSLEALYIASKANYDRLYETSKTPGTISPNDLDQALARKNSDYAQWEAAKSAYREIADTRGYLEIRAPFNGVISARNVNAGAYVGPSGKGSELPMFTLQEQRKLRLIIAVPELYTSYLEGKDKVSFSVKAFPSQHFTAAINRMAGALDTRLRSQRIEMDVINDNKKLLPGMVAEVNIPLAGKDSTLIIPKSALINGTERVFVIKVNGGRAEWIDVQKGAEE
ncbi:MAG: efflux RND transporter periplasmic adaptor subunit, partial [Bacteroidetes bacterium]|nr:efflux RND transporter periplasmic adaptor subunit [Bacteroidota bacterium]